MRTLLALLLAACSTDFTPPGGSDPVEGDTDTDADADTDTDTDTDLPGSDVGVSGGGFTLRGAPWRFVGFNARGLVHYGGGDILPYSSSADLGNTLDAAVAAGGEVVRVFAGNQYADVNTAVERVGETLDQARDRGLHVIVVLTDFYASGFSPPGDDIWYFDDGSGWVVLGTGWFESGWHDNYEPWVQAVVSRNKGHPALFAWELGNELKHGTDPEALITWVGEVTDVIRTRDPDTLVGGGFISTADVGVSLDQAQRLYWNLDFMTVHLYDGAEDGDLATAGTLGKALLVEEAGFQGDGRGASVQAHAESMFAQGADGYMQWGLMSSPSDNGDGDRTYGMDKVYHTDWDELTVTYDTIASGL